MDVCIYVQFYIQCIKHLYFIDCTCNVHIYNQKIAHPCTRRHKCNVYIHHICVHMCISVQLYVYMCTLYVYSIKCMCSIHQMNFKIAYIYIHINDDLRGAGPRVLSGHCIWIHTYWVESYTRIIFRGVWNMLLYFTHYICILTCAESDLTHSLICIISYLCKPWSMLLYYIFTHPLYFYSSEIECGDFCHFWHHTDMVLYRLVSALDHSRHILLYRYGIIQISQCIRSSEVTLAASQHMTCAESDLTHWLICTIPYLYDVRSGKSHHIRSRMSKIWYHISYAMKYCTCIWFQIWYYMACERQVGGWGRVQFSRNSMSPTPRRKWYLTTGRRAH